MVASILPSEINHPDIISELEEQFAAYDRALSANDVGALNAFFFEAATTVRFGMRENLFGHEDIVQYRSAFKPSGTMQERERTIVTTFGSNFGVVATTSHTRGNSRKPTRTMQTWVRLAEGWRIVAAHVSLLTET